MSTKKMLLYWALLTAESCFKRSTSEPIFFVRAAVTLFLCGLEFMSVHQQPSRACNAEGIVSASESLKESQPSRGTALPLQWRSYLPICSFNSVVKRKVKGNLSDNIEQWILHFLHHLLL